MRLIDLLKVVTAVRCLLHWSECLPSKGLSHLCHASVSREIHSNEPQGTALFCLDRCDMFLFVGGPHRCGALNFKSNLGLFFDLGTTLGKTSAQEPQDFCRLCLKLSYVTVPL